MIKRFSKIKIKRLKDSLLREGREDYKRVYEFRINENIFVVNLYILRSPRTEKLFKNNVMMLKIMNSYKIPSPRLFFHSFFDLVFVVSYAGVQLDHYLKKTSFSRAKEKISQVPDLILKTNYINQSPHKFILPRPLEKFFEAHQKRVFQKLPLSVKQKLSSFVKKIKSQILKLSKNKYFYGYGCIDDDIINFAVNNKGRVSRFDFDGTRKKYDPYYELGYFYVSLERLIDKKRICLSRETFLNSISFSGLLCKERFLLGAIGALSIKIFHHPREAKTILRRLKEIEKLCKTIENGCL